MELSKTADYRFQVISPAEEVEIAFAFPRAAEVEDAGNESFSRKSLGEKSIAPVGGLRRGSRDAVTYAKGRLEALCLRRIVYFAGNG